MDTEMGPLRSSLKELRAQVTELERKKKKDIHLAKAAEEVGAKRSPQCLQTVHLVYEIPPEIYTLAAVPCGIATA